MMELDYHSLAQACGFGKDLCDFVFIALNAYKEEQHSRNSVKWTASKWTKDKCSKDN